MANRLAPEVSILCYPHSAIPNRGPVFFAADLMGELVFSGFGDYAGQLPDGASSISAGASWAGQWQFTALSGVEFLRFLKEGRAIFGAQTPPDGSKSESRDVAGFVLAGREAVLDCKIGDNAADLDGGNTNLNWTEISGTWKTVLPPEVPQRTCIANTGSDTLAQAMTTGNLPANRSFGCPLVFAGHNPSGPLPGFRLMWGGDGDGSWSILGRHGQHWAIEKKLNGAWQTVKVLTLAPVANLHGGVANIAIRRYLGRLVVTINGAHYWVVDYAIPLNGGGERRPEPREVVWPEGQLFVNAYNCKVRLGVSAWKYSAANGTPFTGTISRRLNRTSYLPEDATFVTQIGGYRWHGCTVTPVVSVETNAVDYTLTLTANTDGIDTPEVHSVMIQKAPTVPGPSASALDIAPAVKRLTITKANPPGQPGDGVSIEVSREILESLSGYDADKVKDFCPIVVKTRWRYDDGSASSWEVPFAGEIYGVTKKTTGANRRYAAIRGRDNIVRLQKPASTIDHHMPPLDFWFAQSGTLLSGAATPTGDFYAADGIQKIIELLLGSTESGALNGNGNARRYLPSSQPPLLTVSGDACGYFEFQALVGAANGYNAPPPMVGGFYFQAPYRKAAWDWIGDLAQKEQSILCRRWIGESAASAPVLCYGRPLNLISTRATKRIADRNYITGDLAKLLLSAQTETRPERQINRVIATSRPLQGGLEALAPALEIFEAQLPATDDNASTETYERTEWVSEDIAALPGFASVLANALIAQLTGVTWLWPTDITIRGEANYQYGDTVEFQMDGALSDATIGLDGETFRVEGVTHSIELDDSKDWQTTLGLRPLTAAERAAL